MSETRREFIGMLGGAAAWPFAVLAQQAKQSSPVVAYVAPAAEISRISEFRKGLNEVGYFEGRNVSIEIRTGPYEQVRAIIDDLARRGVAIIFVAGTFHALSAKAATAAIPIVFVLGSDPVKLGLAASLNRPAGNVTGLTLITHELLPKHLELVREIVATPDLVGVLLNPGNPDAGTMEQQVSAAANKLGQRIEVMNASSEPELEAAFGSLAKRGAGALVVASDSFFNNHPQPFARLALSHRIPAIFISRLFVEAGGLMSYGTYIPDVYRQAGIYAGRILSGEKPSELPILQPTKFELVINLKTAKSMGLDIPATLLARANEVIE